MKKLETRRNNISLPVRYPSGRAEDMAKKLTDISIKKIRPDPAKRLEIPDAGKPGLYLVIQPSGKKSWAVRYRFNGKPRKNELSGVASIPLPRRTSSHRRPFKPHPLSISNA